MQSNDLDISMFGSEPAITIEETSISGQADGDETACSSAAAASGQYLYIFACHESEQALCRLEQRMLFGCEAADGWLLSSRRLDPSRSPFIKLRLDVQLEGVTVAAIAQQAAAIRLNGATFKLHCIPSASGRTTDYAERRAIEREVGSGMSGRADMRRAEFPFGLFEADGRWLFGAYREAEALWLRHNAKPQTYSTALSTRVARAVVNIAAPVLPGAAVVDPCCGIGTVLIEALSMGCDIVGFDLNPLAVRGARLNLQHFEMPDIVSIGDLRSMTGSFDAAIVDLPYNRCSVLPAEERQQMLLAAGRIASRSVILSTEPISEAIINAGFAIMDGCELHKGNVTRRIFVCEAVQT